jgi:hypothetical protein
MRVSSAAINYLYGRGEKSFFYRGMPAEHRER